MRNVADLEDIFGAEYSMLVREGLSDGEAIISGCAPSAGSGDSVDVAAGSARVGGSDVSVSSKNVSLASRSSFTRIDLIGIDSSGDAVVESGQSGNTAPSLPSNRALVAVVKVPPADISTSITVFDARWFPDIAFFDAVTVRNNANAIDRPGTTLTLPGDTEAQTVNVDGDTAYLPTRTSDPSSPVTAEAWLRTDTSPNELRVQTENKGLVTIPLLDPSNVANPIFRVANDSGTTRAFEALDPSNADHPWLRFHTENNGDLAFHGTATDTGTGTGSGQGTHMFINEGQTTYLYDSQNDSWQSITSPPNSHTFLNNCPNVNGKIHLIGGRNSVKHDIYDVASDSYTTVSDFPDPDGWGQYEAHGDAPGPNGDIIYTHGGGSTSSNDKTVFEYDISGDSYSSVKESPTIGPRYPAVGTYQDEIYYVGGDGRETLTNKYDPGSNSFTTLTNAPENFDGAAGVMISNKLYVFGGVGTELSGVTASAVYDADADSWSNIADVPTGRGYMGILHSTDGLIYTAGGIDSSSNGTDVVEIYDPNNDTWTTGTSAPATYKYAHSGFANP